jgi:hypothetical protein
MKKLLAGIVAMAGVAAFADAANTLVYFSSQGPDKYADGTTVLDGERYALVWSEDGNFDGFTVTGDPVDSKDVVFSIMSRAKGGRCPMTAFQVDSKVAPTNGVYAVYLLDTRIDIDGKAELSKMEDGKPQVIKATSTTVASYAVKGASSFGAATQTSAEATASAGSVTPIAPGASAAPVVTGIKVEGAYVYITVKNTSPFLSYDVVGAENAADVDKGTKKDVEQQPGALNTDEEITFIVPKENSGKFFKVRRN